MNLDLDSTQSAHVTMHQLSNINKTVSGQMEFLVFGGRDFVMSPKLRQLTIHIGISKHLYSTKRT
jgi:hypothetical protein